MVSKLESNLKRRFREFLYSDRDEKAVAVRRSTQEVLDRVVRNGWRAYVVGGTLRDVMLTPPYVFPRDIDFIVSGVSSEAIEDAFKDLLDRQTRFGGLHLVTEFKYGGITSSSGQVVFDAWRLEDTWGIGHARLDPTIDSFVRTPFLNIDSVAIELVPRGARRHVAHCGFFESLSSRTLEINYEPNPFPHVCVVRSLIMAAKLKFSLGSALARYIADYSRRYAADNLIDAQISHFGQVRSHRDELQQWLDDVSAGVSAGEERVEICASEKRQLELWNDWPPSSDAPPLSSPGNRHEVGVRETLGASAAF